MGSLSIKKWCTHGRMDIGKIRRKKLVNTTSVVNCILSLIQSGFLPIHGKYQYNLSTLQKKQVKYSHKGSPTMIRLLTWATTLVAVSNIFILDQSTLILSADRSRGPLRIIKSGTICGRYMLTERLKNLVL